MKKFAKAFLVLLMVGSTFTSAIHAQQSELTNEELASLVLPIVQSYETEAGSSVWKMDESTRFVIPDTDDYVKNERLKEVVELVAAEFLEKEIPGKSEIEKVYAKESEITPNDIVVTLDKESNITEESDSDEAYQINIDDSGVTIVAASENAVLHALRTIQHFMITYDSGLSYGEIIDYPEMDERRIHIDIARKYFSKEWIIQQIRELSYLKMNTIQLHFNENMGFRIESETDPAIVSKDGYLTKDEVREILAEAKKYGISVIPSLDTPGHTEHILKVHPEYGQVDINGDHSDVAFDVTNPEAVDYLKSLYTEYMELFEGSTDFHIGADEYMEFDREPFTTDYKPVLNDYAKETLGEDYIWKDVIANFVNEIAEHVYEGGFEPRIWNDGIYYGETDKNAWDPDESKQKIVMHDYIGIDFWSQMAWNKSIAKLDTFVEKGHQKIYNLNASYFYYVLRNDKPDDGRDQHSFDHLNQDQRIYEEWTPGKFQENTVDDDSEFIKGASLAIWNDNPDLVGEDVITEDISKELRALASKSWNTASNEIATLDQFKANYEKLGNVAAFTKGSKLPEVQPVKPVEPTEPEPEPEPEPNPDPKPDPDPEPADKSKLDNLLQEVADKKESDYTSKSWEAFAESLTDAKAVQADEDATQEAVDQSFTALQTAIDQLKKATKPGKETEEDPKEENKDTDTDDSNVEQNDDNRLPNTATTMYNWIVVGLLVTIAGVVTLIVRRKRTVN